METKSEHYLVREVRRLVAENPNFVYVVPETINRDGELSQGESCLYIANGAASCGVGQALVNTGRLDPSRPYGKRGERIENTGAGVVTEYLGLRVPERQRVWLDCFQRKQDEGKTWAEAQAYADEYVYGKVSE